MADKRKDFFFTIKKHISVIRSTIKAVTPASMPFKIAAITVLEINML